MDAIRKIEAALADVINEERPKFEKWAVSTEPLADVRAMAIHRKPDGQYSMLTARAGFAAWMGGALTEREQQAQILASKEAELVRLLEESKRTARNRDMWKEQCATQAESLARLRETLHGIATTDFRAWWQELQTADDFVAWAKSRARHALTQPPKEPT